MRAARSSSELKTTARPSASKSSGEAALRLEGLGARADDAAVDPGRGGREALLEALAGDTQAIEMEQPLELREHGSHTAAGEKILHVMLADRLQIDQHRGRIADLVQAGERNLDAEPAGDGTQMDDGVG